MMVQNFKIFINIIMDYITILGLVAAVGSGILFAVSSQQPSTPSPPMSTGGKKTRRKRK